MALLAAVACFSAAADPPPVIDPALSGCRRAIVSDARSGRALRGIEDIAVHPAANIAYLSADDRWAVERSLVHQGGAGPQGGIYLLPLDRVSLQSDRLEVADLTDTFETEHSFHPHGIDLVVNADGRAVLYVINRRHPLRNRTQDGQPGAGRAGSQWDTMPTVEVFDVDEAGGLHHRRTVRDQRLCRVNEIAGIDPDRFLVSNDGGSCGRWGRRLERALGLKRGNVVLVEMDEATGASTITRIAEGIGFANGLAVDAQHLYVAATREQALLVYRLDDFDETGGPAAPVGTIAIAGGPDNLSWVSEHVLLVAVHPSLLRLAAYRYQWTSLVPAAPTRILSVNVQDGSWRTLFASDTGEPLAAATVAIAHGGYLIAGSVVDQGLLICDLGTVAG